MLNARRLWIALNYVSLKDWIQLKINLNDLDKVVNCFKLCIFERLNTIKAECCHQIEMLWIALNYVSLKDWIQSFGIIESTGEGCELL